MVRASLGKQGTFPLTCKTTEAYPMYVLPVATLLEKHDAAPQLPQRAKKLSVASIMFL